MKSLERLKVWNDELEKYVKEKVPITIAANKTDLVDEVSRDIVEAVEKFAQFINANIVYTSVKTGQGINDLFEKLIQNKKIEWDQYRIQVTDYELKRYLSIL